MTRKQFPILFGVICSDVIRMVRFTQTAIIETDTCSSAAVRGSVFSRNMSCTVDDIVIR